MSFRCCKWSTTYWRKWVNLLMQIYVGRECKMWGNYIRCLKWAESAFLMLIVWIQFMRNNAQPVFGFKLKYIYIYKRNQTKPNQTKTNQNKNKMSLKCHFLFWCLVCLTLPYNVQHSIYVITHTSANASTLQLQ